jgi:hypothetical protein
MCISLCKSIGTRQVVYAGYVHELSLVYVTPRGYRNSIIHTSKFIMSTLLPYDLDICSDRNAL